jgi:hypothetical protein
MFTVILNYTGASGLADDLKKRSKDFETEIGSVPGFIAYYLVKTTDGIASVTLCENKAAATNRQSAQGTGSPECAEPEGRYSASHLGRVGVQVCGPQDDFDNRYTLGDAGCSRRAVNARFAFSLAPLARQSSRQSLIFVSDRQD